MIDLLTLALGHGLLAIAAWRLLWRADLDDAGAEPGPAKPRRPGFAARAAQDSGTGGDA